MAETTSITFNPQLLTSFPNLNDKHIDYVIVYEKIEESKANESDNVKKTLARQAFFEKLKSEKIDIYEMESKEKNKTFIFVLLHCPVERLFEEAELTRLEMVLKDVIWNFILNIAFDFYLA